MQCPNCGFESHNETNAARIPVSHGPVDGADNGIDESPATPELSVVIPCLNEADTLGDCLKKAQSAIREQAIEGEIIVVDNGSTDGSAEIAKHLGARVVIVASRGYGSALMGGIAAARGQFVIM